MDFDLERPRLLLLVLPCILLLVGVALVPGSSRVRFLRLLVRMAASVLIIAALAGPVERLPVRTPGRLLVAIDASSSMLGPSGQTLRDRLARMEVAEGHPPPLLVEFDTAARSVPWPPATDDPPTSPASPRGTRLLPAVELAAATGRGASLLLATDGVAPDLEAAARTAARAGLRLHPLNPDDAPGDRAVASLSLPPCRASEPFAVDASVLATGRVERAELVLTLGGTEASRIDLSARTTETVRFKDLVLDSGRHEIEVRIEPPDGDPRNDVLRGTLEVGQPPRCLVVGPANGARALEQALLAQGILAERKGDLAGLLSRDELSRFSTVVLHLGGDPLPRPDEVLLQDFVTEGGGGLLVVVSDRSSLPGTEPGPLEKLLPVTLVPRPEAPEKTRETGDEPGPPADPDPLPPPTTKDDRPGERPPPIDSEPVKARKPVARKVKASSLTLLLVIDTSGSMRGQGILQATTAATATARNLRPGDRLGILAFDSKPHWVVPVTRIEELGSLDKRLAALDASGDTEFFPVLAEAVSALREETSSIRHAIFLTDGESNEFKDFRVLLQGARRSGITVSTVGLGSSTNARRLGQFAEWGGGSFYAVYDPRKIPEIYHLEVGQVLGKAQSLDAPEVALPESVAEAAPSPGGEQREETGLTVPAEEERGPGPVADADPAPEAGPGSGDAAPSPDVARPETPGGDEHPLPLEARKVVIAAPSPFIGEIAAEDLPGVMRAREATLRIGGWAPLQLEDGQPFLATWMAGTGKVAVLTAGIGSREEPDWSSWPQLPRFVAQTVRFLEGRVHDDPTAVDTPSGSRVAAVAELLVLTPDLDALAALARETGGATHPESPPTLPSVDRIGEEVRDRSLLLLLGAVLLLPVDAALGRRERERSVVRRRMRRPGVDTPASI